MGMCYAMRITPNKLTYSTLTSMGVGVQNTLGGTKFLPEKFVTATTFCPKKFEHIIYRNGIKITHFRPQMLIARKSIH